MNLPHQYAIVVSEFNHEITDKLLAGALAHLNTRHIAKENIKVVKVPGAVEIPLTAKLLAKSKKYSAILCLGCVIRGETSHYDYVCQQVSNGCQQVALELEIPIIFGVLTTENEEQALARVGGVHGHKGIDCAEAMLRMSELQAELAVTAEVS